jgi:hypothetical protein
VSECGRQIEHGGISLDAEVRRHQRSIEDMLRHRGRDDPNGIQRSGVGLDDVDVIRVRLAWAGLHKNLVPLARRTTRVPYVSSVS